jgi:hypothetical protein
MRIMTESMNRWPRSSRVPILLLLFAAVAASGGCRERKERSTVPPRPELQRAAAMLEQYYVRAVPGNGWKITSIVPQEDQVQVFVEIPAEQAHTIMARPAEEQFRTVAAAVCPARSELAPQLPPAASLRVLPMVSGQVFIEVECGR